MRHLRHEFRGLSPTPLAKDLGLLAAGIIGAVAAWAVLVFFIWCAS